MGRLGLSRDHGSCVEDGRYISSDSYESYKGDLKGSFLCLAQSLNSEEPPEWHLHQDFVIALELKREGDVWLGVNEGYVEVAKLHRENGSPCLLEVRAEYLKDYLCARDCGLYFTSFRSRREVVEDASHIKWPGGRANEKSEAGEWIGHIGEIHEGGMPYGQTTAVFHVARTDVDPDAEVPEFGLPRDEDVVSKQWVSRSSGQKLYSIRGELWKSEWFDKGASSPRIRRDEVSPTVFFITDAAGTRESQETLDKHGRYLWFKPEVMMELAHRRGGSLEWYTRETGKISGSPGNGVHFGVNRFGQINVYAKDIGYLPEWQQRIWAAHNLGPDGGVSEELQDSHIRAAPANTQAPELFLGRGIDQVNSLSRQLYGFDIFKAHSQKTDILKRVHQFRATDKIGLLSLAKDCARIVVDTIDINALHKMLKNAKAGNFKSMKSLESLLATLMDARDARAMLTPLAGVYELRHADAHLPSSEIDDYFKMLKIDQSLPHVHQGRLLLASVVTCIYDVSESLHSKACNR